MSDKNKETSNANAVPGTNRTANKTAALYDDGNIPKVDLKDVIPDEVPRKDGPGGEGEN